MQTSVRVSRSYPEGMVQNYTGDMHGTSRTRHRYDHRMFPSAFGPKFGCERDAGSPGLFWPFWGFLTVAGSHLRHLVSFFSGF